jgi:hypothetical protein
MAKNIAHPISAAIVTTTIAPTLHEFGNDTLTYHTIGDVVATGSPFSLVVVTVVTPGTRASNYE